MIPELEWKWSPEFHEFTAEVKAVNLATGQAGRFEIHIIQRPPYCDRGRWYVLVEGVPLDGQEGFPRYYFKEANAKEEMLLWVNAREEVHRAYGSKSV